MDFYGKSNLTLFSNIRQGFDKVGDGMCPNFSIEVFENEKGVKPFLFCF